MNSIINNNSSDKINNEKKKITIITPCSRPENLVKMYLSIDFNYIDEWIIVYDGKIIDKIPNYFEFCINKPKIKEYIHTDKNSFYGNSQRNFALDNISNKNTYIYYLDDDNIIHHDLYKLLDIIVDNKMYSFNQIRPDYLLKGNNIRPGNIDTSMILIDFNLCHNLRWINNISESNGSIFNLYESDGYYITQCYNLNKDKHIYYDNYLCYHNKIR
jgi:hypothetical protein